MQMWTSTSLKPGGKKTRVFPTMFPMRLILLPFHGPTLILVPDLLRVLNHALVPSSPPPPNSSHCCWHNVTCRKWLRIVTITKLVDRCQTTAVYLTTQNTHHRVNNHRQLEENSRLMIWSVMQRTMCLAWGKSSNCVEQYKVKHQDS